MIEIYQVSKKLTFILTDTKTIVKTPLQENLIVYSSGNYKRQWVKLRDKIRNNEINNINELLEYNNPKIGGITQIQGLVLVNTSIERHV